MTTVAYKKERIESSTPEEQAACLKYLQALIDVRIKELDRAIGLVPQYMWDNYKSMGAEGLREQRIRKKAEDDLVNDWRCRPAMLRKIANVADGKAKSRRTRNKAKDLRGAAGQIDE